MTFSAWPNYRAASYSQPPHAPMKGSSRPAPDYLILSPPELVHDDYEEEEEEPAQIPASPPPTPPTACSLIKPSDSAPLASSSSSSSSSTGATSHNVANSMPTTDHHEQPRAIKRRRKCAPSPSPMQKPHDRVFCWSPLEKSNMRSFAALIQHEKRRSSHERVLMPKIIHLPRRSPRPLTQTDTSKLETMRLHAFSSSNSPASSTRSASSSPIPSSMNKAAFSARHTSLLPMDVDDTTPLTATNAVALPLAPPQAPNTTLATPRTHASLPKHQQQPAHRRLDLASITGDTTISHLPSNHSNNSSNDSSNSNSSSYSPSPSSPMPSASMAAESSSPTSTFDMKPLVSTIATSSFSTNRPTRSKGPCQACQESSEACMRKAFNWPFPSDEIFYDKGKPFCYLCNKCGLRYNKSGGCVCRHCRWVLCKEEKRKALQHIEAMRQSRPDGYVDLEEEIPAFICTPKYWHCGHPWKVKWILSASDDLT